MGDFLLLTVRGELECPEVVLVDLCSRKIDRIQLPHKYLDLSSIPFSKRGTTGIEIANGVIYVASWNSIFVLDASSLKLLDVIRDNRFSDLHGICVDENGALWITSTNLDGVYVYEGHKVFPFWHAWESDDLLKKQYLSCRQFDFSQLTKEYSPYHKYHINDVCVVGNSVYATFLGGVAPSCWKDKIRKKLHLIKRKRFGGLFILDRYTKKKRAFLSTEGLHDALLFQNKVLFLEYFGHRLVKFCSESKRMNFVTIDIPSKLTAVYLSRGLLVDTSANEVWIGHTVHNNFKLNYNAVLRKYSLLTGKWLGEEIFLEGYRGIYGIVNIGV